jgi:hypothetical protein
MWFFALTAFKKTIAIIGAVKIFVDSIAVIENIRRERKKEALNDTKIEERMAKLEAMAEGEKGKKE